MSTVRAVDLDWYKTTEGQLCIQQLFKQNNQKRKQFGLLERPNFSPGTPEIFYKIYLVGKSASGKSKVVSLLSGFQNDDSGYSETVGVHVKNIYWPAKIHGRVSLFKLQLWESGEQYSKRYSYISSVCSEKADMIAIVINKSDESSLEYLKNKWESLAGICPTIMVIALDTDREKEIQDLQLQELAQTKNVPLLHLPHNFPAIDGYTTVLNTICNFLYSSTQSHENHP